MLRVLIPRSEDVLEVVYDTCNIKALSGIYMGKKVPEAKRYKHSRFYHSRTRFWVHHWLEI